ncbi:ABC transporter ATP-binding protein [Lichenifustis flavocetrariae]|uniref:ABC transporter ATP-binding protein n=1 Tax=Lichenifustis flavocetrariae TaxID=2949735 RepID=A0AA42CKY7_9HYPH|nr:ABC transporter ATP-binding protein [Lichenifustis flavocetrariae]MCW6509781.1 ABC transporter ATP-binding protein [Lichenifustis flavocetrariae]
MATITFDDVTKRYDNGHIALDRLSLDVREGEFLILVGPSGCGKSTALRIAAGLDRPTSGRLFIGGDLANDMAPRDRNIAMVFQSYALYPHLTVAQNIGFGLRVRNAGSAEIDQKVRAVAATLELTDYLGRKPAQLSGGQRQRVAMARALVRSPQAFLMDEPLSNLDARLRGQMREEIVALQRRTGTTTVYVTHDQVEAMTMGSRVAILDRGVLQQVGPPRSLYDSPANRFVAGFIGSPAMNFLSAVLPATGSSQVLHLGPHVLPVSEDHFARSTAFGDHGDRQVVIGIRPEAVRPASLSDGSALPGIVRFVEDLGATLLVSVDFENVVPLGTGSGGDDDEFVAARRPVKVALQGRHRITPGDLVHWAINTNDMHLFDAQTGAALRP